MNPIKGSLRHPSVVLVLTAMAVAVGIHALMTMPRTEDPTVTIRTGLVIAQYPGATSEQMEKQVTKTLEKHIFKFPGGQKGVDLFHEPTGQPCSPRPRPAFGPTRRRPDRRRP